MFSSFINRSLVTYALTLRHKLSDKFSKSENPENPEKPDKGTL